MRNQAETRIVERTQRVPRPTIQSSPTVPLQIRNAKSEGVATKSFSLSDVEVLPILTKPIIEDEKTIETQALANLMVDATRNFSGNIDDWQFSTSDCMDDLILRCASHLKDRAKIDHIAVLQEDTDLRLVLKRHIGNRSTVYCIPLRPILLLRWKNRILFDILLSFVKKLPYINLFHIGEGRIDWLWEYLFEEEAYHKKNGSVFSNANSVKFFDRYQKLFDAYETQDWKSLLVKYSPRKSLHKQIKELLLKADAIDFQVPFRIGTRDAYESMFEHWESFLIVDDSDSEFTRSYIEMLNECSNEHDIISAYAFTTIEKGNIQPFDEGLSYNLNRLEEFLTDLNELLRQL
tara:strand:+ start:25465 stop:26508 length:1044 start_codon:yes stop_codon:yes gene_type:complete